MAKRMALIPEELISSYNLQKPELRLEDDIDLLLEKAHLPDDMKAKLLGQLIMRYHKTVHAPPDPINVNVVNEHKSTEINEEIDQKSKKIAGDKVLDAIMISIPQNYAKFILMIVEKLKSRQYSWNDEGEMTKDHKPIRGSSIVDFFSYTMRNVQSMEEPKYYDHFLKAIKEINIPRGWIGNKKVLSQIDITPPPRTDFIKSEEGELYFRKKKGRSKSDKPYETGKKNRSSDDSKWLNWGKK